MTRRRSPRVTALALAAVALGSGCAGRESVPVPGDAASPEDVARAFALAQSVGDCDTANRLFDAMSGRHAACSSQGEPATVVGPAAADSGSPQDRGLPAGSTVVTVPVERVVREGGFLGIGAQEHTAPWSYVLMRRGDGKPWRVVDQGLG